LRATHEQELEARVQFANKGRDDRLRDRDMDYLLLKDDKRAFKSEDVDTLNATTSRDSDDDKREFMFDGHASLVESDGEGDLGANIWRN
jgi:hypothetical protein